MNANNSVTVVFNNLIEADVKNDNFGKPLSIQVGNLDETSLQLNSLAKERAKKFGSRFKSAMGCESI